jgi:hypothetical protein
MALTGCAHDGYYGSGYGYPGGGYYDQSYMNGDGYRGSHGYGERYRSPFQGRGAPLLDPWLANTHEGQQFVLDHYEVGPRGDISRSDARGANAFFRRWADTDRDYRLTDPEIRTALVFVRDRYGRRY